MDALCRFKLTISCGQFADPPSYERFLAREGIAPEEVEEFRYRGHGCPGWSPYVRTKAGREAVVDYRDFWCGAFGVFCNILSENSRFSHSSSLKCCSYLQMHL